MPINVNHEGAIEPIAVPLPRAPAVFGMSRSAIYRAAAAGDIVLMKAGRATLVDCASVRAYFGRLERLTPKVAV